MTTESPEDHMRHAFSLARKGYGQVSPNPPVGAVLVKNGKILGEGYHEKYGEHHAEKNALRDAISRGHSPEGADIFVTLEPCSHYGKTPPCAELLLSEGISRVFFSVSDPNAHSSGGKEILQQGGVEVFSGLCEEEGRELIRVFSHCQKHSRPYCIAKIALSAEGAFGKSPGIQTHITGPEAQKWTHQLRQECDGILVGCNTVLADDPLLSVRYGISPRDPIRIILDPHSRLPHDAQVFRDDNFIHVTSTNPLFGTSNTILLSKNSSGNIDIDSLLQQCFLRKIQSILIEGGGRTLSSFLEAGCIDEFYFLHSQTTLVDAKMFFDFSQYKERFVCIERQLLGKDEMRRWVLRESLDRVREQE